MCVCVCDTTFNNQTINNHCECFKKQEPKPQRNVVADKTLDMIFRCVILIHTVLIFNQSLFCFVNAAFSQNKRTPYFCACILFVVLKHLPNTCFCFAKILAYKKMQSTPSNYCAELI